MPPIRPILLLFFTNIMSENRIFEGKKNIKETIPDKLISKGGYYAGYI